MREIKFRAWNKNWDEMFYSSNNVIFNKREFSPFMFEIGFISYPEDDWIYMQYIGLKDKNGKEIYEGDILSYFGMLFVIEFEYGQFFGNCKSDNLIFIDSSQDTYEVVGNIYENPELIK